MVLISFSNSDTLLPELHNFLGSDKFLEFLDTFSGVTVDVPSPKSLTNSIEDCVIYRQLSHIGGPKNLRETRRLVLAKSLATRFNTTTRKVLKRYEKAKSILSKVLVK